MPKKKKVEPVAAAPKKNKKLPGIFIKGNVRQRHIKQGRVGMRIVNVEPEGILLTGYLLDFDAEMLPTDFNLETHEITGTFEYVLNITKK